MLITFVHCEFGTMTGVLSLSRAPLPVRVQTFWYLKSQKRVVEFVFPRAASVLFFKLKITGITRPWSSSAANEVAKEMADSSRITEMAPRREPFLAGMTAVSISNLRI